MTEGASAIIFHYDSFNKTKKTCSLASWSGTEPNSGKLTVKSSYTHTDGVTYTVTKIGSHALDNLKSVTEIVIPASIVQIGHAAIADKGSNGAYAANFSGCPKLKRFTVDAGNANYQSSAGGILYYKGLANMIRVPQKFAVTDSALTIGNTTMNICRDAFVENASIKTLTLPRSCYLFDNAGLNKALKLAKYKVTGTGSQLEVINGAYVQTGNELVSLPVRNAAKTYTVPTKVDKIHDYAFYGVPALQTVDMSAVTRIGKYAFAASGLKKATVPGTVTRMMKGVFSSCASLTEITLESVDAAIPERFAFNCDALQTIVSENPIGSIGTDAFRECPALRVFPFNGQTQMEGDSIFYNSGLREVVFEESKYVSGFPGVDIFSLCRDLQLIDLSALTDTDKWGYTFSDTYAQKDLKLRTIKMPAFATTARTEYYLPAFGYSCVATKIVLHTFDNSAGKQQFIYSSGSDGSLYKPNVYVAVTRNSLVDPEYYNKWPLGTLFGAANGATVEPVFYCDAAEPAEDYVMKGASYFVPGACVSKYSGAQMSGCEVKEMYSIDFEKRNGLLQVSVKPLMPEGHTLTDFKVHVNGDVNGDVNGEALPASGVYTTRISHTAVKSIAISYTLDREAMMTSYDNSFWTPSGIDGVAAEGEDADASYYDLQGRKLEAAPSDGLYIEVKGGKSKVLGK